MYTCMNTYTRVYVVYVYSAYRVVYRYIRVYDVRIRGTCIQYIFIILLYLYMYLYVYIGPARVCVPELPWASVSRAHMLGRRHDRPSTDPFACKQRQH